MTFRFLDSVLSAVETVPLFLTVHKLLEVFYLAGFSYIQGLQYAGFLREGKVYYRLDLESFDHTVLFEPSSVKSG